MAKKIGIETGWRKTAKAGQGCLHEAGRRKLKKAERIFILGRELGLGVAIPLTTALLEREKREFRRRVYPMDSFSSEDEEIKMEDLK